MSFRQTILRTAKLLQMPMPAGGPLRSILTDCKPRCNISLNLGSSMPLLQVHSRILRIFQEAQSQKDQKVSISRRKADSICVEYDSPPHAAEASSIQADMILVASTSSLFTYSFSYYLLICTSPVGTLLILFDTSLLFKPPTAFLPPQSCLTLSHLNQRLLEFISNIDGLIKQVTEFAIPAYMAQLLLIASALLLIASASR